MPITITLLGAKGRMGSRLTALIENDASFQLGEWQHCDVAIDFSSPAAVAENLRRASSLKKPLVIGTTGHTPESYAAIETASRTLPILFSPNFSLGMAACFEAASILARRLQGICTIDIVEAHHALKKDKPSGTALTLAQAMHCPSAPIHSIRAGDTIGDHTVIFTCAGEKIELRHQVSTRDAFAKGALQAAKFVVGKPPGLYSLKDLFP